MALINHKTMSAIGRNDVFCSFFKRKHRTHVIIDAQVRHQPHRLPEPAPRRNLVGIDVKELARRIEQNNLVGRIGVNGKLQRIVFLKLKLVGQRHIAFHAPNPPLLRQNNRNRLLLDHRLNRHVHVFRHICKLAAPASERRLFAELFFHLVDFLGQPCKTQFLAAQQLFQPVLFFRQFVKFAADFLFLQLAQIAQFHIEDGLRLIVRQTELRHQCCLGVFFFADNADNLVQIQIRHQISGQDFQPCHNLVQSVL